jgi:heme exporter protein B
MGRFLQQICALMVFELRLIKRRSQDTFMVIMFFILIAVLFPFALGPAAPLLERVAGGVLWVAALLALLLSLERLFANDWQDGGLEQWAQAPLALEWLVMIRLLGHWLSITIPLLCIIPLLGLWYHLPAWPIFILCLSLLLGTPCLLMMGAFGAALILGARRSGLLVALIILPLYIPMVIFGAGSVESALTGGIVRPYLSLLAALMVLLLAASPWAIAAILRLALSE